MNGLSEDNRLSILLDLKLNLWSQLVSILNKQARKTFVVNYYINPITVRIIEPFRTFKHLSEKFSLMLSQGQVIQTIFIFWFILKIGPFRNHFPKNTIFLPGHTRSCHRSDLRARLSLEVEKEYMFSFLLLFLAKNEQNLCCTYWLQKPLFWTGFRQFVPFVLHAKLPKVHYECFRWKYLAKVRGSKNTEQNREDN